MGALSLAILDQYSRPLFLQEFGEVSPSPSDEEMIGLDVPASESLECSTRLQFIMHAALDRLDQLMDQSAESRWGVQPGGAESDGKFIGLLVPVEEMRVYGKPLTGLD
jgi:hypothetical protein